MCWNFKWTNTNGANLYRRLKFQLQCPPHTCRIVAQFVSFPVHRGMLFENCKFDFFYGIGPHRYNQENTNLLLKLRILLVKGKFSLVASLVVDLYFERICLRFVIPCFYEASFWSSQLHRTDVSLRCQSRSGFLKYAWKPVSTGKSKPKWLTEPILRVIDQNIAKRYHFTKWVELPRSELEWYELDAARFKGRHRLENRREGREGWFLNE